MSDCQFLETGPTPEKPYCCTAGINFYAVGEARALCRTCPLFELEDGPLCQHLEVCTFLRVDRKRGHFIQARLECRLMDRILTNLDACRCCPDYQAEQAQVGTITHWSQTC